MHGNSSGPHGGHGGGGHGGGGHGHGHFHGGGGRGHGHGRGWGGPLVVWPSDTGDVVQDTTVEINNDHRARDGVTHLLIKRVDPPPGTRCMTQYRIVVDAHDVMALGSDKDHAAIAVLQKRYSTPLEANTAARATFRFAQTDVR